MPSGELGPQLTGLGVDEVRRERAGVRRNSTLDSETSPQ